MDLIMRHGDLQMICDRYSSCCIQVTPRTAGFMVERIYNHLNGF